MSTDRLDRMEAAIERLIKAQEDQAALQVRLHHERDQRQQQVEATVAALVGSLNFVSGGDFKDTKTVVAMRESLEAADRIRDGLNAFGSSVLKGAALLSLAAVSTALISHWQAVKQFLGMLK